VNFELSSGEVLVVRGENGAGKTTLVRTLLGMNGEATQLDNRFERIAYLPQLVEKEFFIPTSLRDLLESLGVRELSTRLLSTAQWSRLWNQASGGERQKALLTAALARPADLYVLDEPFNHLDPASKIRVVEWMRELQGDGAAFVLVAHGLEDVISGLPTKEILLRSRGEA